MCSQSWMLAKDAAMNMLQAWEDDAVLFERGEHFREAKDVRRLLAGGQVIYDLIARRFDGEVRRVEGDE